MQVSNLSSTAKLKVDLALVLAVDCSSSVDAADFHLQMTGIAAALRNPPLLDAIIAGPNQRVAITLVQWSNRNAQMIAVPWRFLGSKTDLENCARETEQTARNWLPGGTGLAAAIDFCVELLQAMPFAAVRRAIDVSGDGEDNEDGDVEAARHNAANLGMTINGLPITDGSPRIEAYYRQRVIAGPGAFAIPAANILNFSEAMTQKLLREIQLQNA
jgi:Protein of unknown function (DUF1194)